MRLKKRASLELSINTIVIVVLALTLLGLGLAFIRNQIMNISETTGAVQEQIRQQILDDLRTGNKKLSFPTTEVKVSSDAEQIIAIGVKNTGDSPLNFSIQIDDLNKNTGSPLPDPGDRDDKLSARISEKGGGCRDNDETNTTLKSIAKGDKGGCFFWDSSLQELAVGDSQVYGIKHFAKTKQDTYMYKVTIMSDGEEYSSKTFFVRVV